MTEEQMLYRDELFFEMVRMAVEYGRNGEKSTEEEDKRFDRINEALRDSINMDELEKNYPNLRAEIA